MTYGSNTNTAYLDWQDRQSGSRAADEADDRAHWAAEAERRKAARLAREADAQQFATDLTVSL